MRRAESDELAVLQLGRTSWWPVLTQSAKAKLESIGSAAGSQSPVCQPTPWPTPAIIGTGSKQLPLGRSGVETLWALGGEGPLASLLPGAYRKERR